MNKREHRQVFMGSGVGRRRGHYGVIMGEGHHVMGKTEIFCGCGRLLTQTRAEMNNVCKRIRYFRS